MDAHHAQRPDVVVGERVGQQVKEAERRDDEAQDALLVLRIRPRVKPRAQVGEQSLARFGALRHHAFPASAGSRHSFWICTTCFFMPWNASTRRASRCRPAWLET